MFKGRLFRKTRLAWATLCAGLLATGFTSLQVKQGIEQAALRQFAFSCDQVTFKIQDRLGAYALILRGGSALFAASVSVERKEWQAYVEKLQAKQSVVGVQGIGFAQVIPEDELTNHIAKIRSEGFFDYTVKPPGQRTIYTSIIYLEPFRDRNLRAFGYDMYTEQVRRTAMEHARDTGEAVLSGKVELVQETGADVQAGVLMYVPVYRNGAPVDTVEQRQSALVGWTYSPYRMNDLMTGILADWVNHEGKTIELTIYDGREATPASLLYDSQPRSTADVPSLLYQQRTIDFNGHLWLLVLERTRPLSAIDFAPAWATLAGSLALSGLLFGLLRSVINTQANADRIAEGLTREIRQKQKKIHLLLNSTAEAIYGIDTNGDCTFCNNACLHLLGYQHSDDLLGKNMHWLIHGKHPDGTHFPVEDCRIFQAFHKGERMHVDDEVLWRSDGTSFPAEYWSYPEIQDGKVVGAVVTFLDITERKRADDKLRQLSIAVEQSPATIIITDITGAIEYVNPMFCQVTGYTFAEVLGQNPRILKSGELTSNSYRELWNTILSGKVWRGHFHNKKKSGELFWEQTSISPIKDDLGGIIGFVAVKEDITKLKQYERLIIDSEQRLFDILDVSPIGVCITVNQGCELVFYNQSYAKLIKNLQVIDVNPQRYYANDEDCQTIMAELANGNPVLNRQIEFRNPDDGSKFWALSSYMPMPYKGNDAVLGWFYDITERIEMERELDRQMEVLRQLDEILQITNEEERAIFDSATLGIALIKGRIIVRCNRKLEEILGYATGELDGMPIRLLYPDEAVYQTSIKEVASAKFRFEQQLIRKDGRLFWGMISGQALDSNDPEKGTVELIDDMTLEHEAANALLKAKELAEDAVRIKSEFLANMSHEIRTPMNGVLGMLDLLRETDMTSIQRDWLETAYSSGKTLLGIINDILDISKLEAGKVDVEQIDFNLFDLIDDICAVFAGQAHAKGLELNCSLPVDLSLRWRGDSLRIRQVLTNLIGNAVKFTAQGEVSVSVTPSVLADSQNEQRFEVRDTGIGISAAEQSQLFKPFSQADSSTSRSYGGTGLGLSISKKLVELMGGAIGVDSVLGKGACFWFTLPMMPSESVEPVTASWDISGKRVLIVDDNATNRYILSTYLNRWGVAVSEADNGSAALAHLQTSAQQGEYDLIVLDRQMPIMDGLTLAKCLAQIPALAKIPIILLSSGEPLSLADYQGTGIVQLLLKPVRQLQLFEAIVNTLQGGLAVTPKPERIDIKRPSYQGKKLLVVEDNKINQKVIVAKLAKYDIFPDLAENGQLALDQLAHSTYDLILMDCQMPVMDGYIATAELRLLEARQGIPHQIVIALTANALEGEREKCLAAGMDNYLSKPIVTEQLTAMLASRLGNQLAEIALPLSVAPASSDQNVWDTTAALDNLDGDSALLDTMIVLFLTEVPIQLSELVKFQAEGNLPALANSAHAIKGAVSYFYAASAKDCASLLEKTARSGLSADYQGMTDALINAVTDLINNLRLAKNSTISGKKM